MTHTDSDPQLTLWTIGSQQVSVEFDGGRIVSDAGLLAVRHFEKQLGILEELARRLPDPRSPRHVRHSLEEILTQQVSQFLAGYFDCNDASTLRDDPLFQTLADRSPDQSRNALSSGSTLTRFQYAYTRRQHEQSPQERPALLEQRAAQLQRIQVLNDYLPDLFLRTRRQKPSFVILDLDATDDPTHGQQRLRSSHGYDGQHQYFPLLICDGQSGFPLAAWLRPGTVPASCGAISALDALVQKIRAAWPDVLILVRADTGFATPALEEYCERQGLLYAFGYASNEVLKRKTAQALTEVEVYHAAYHQEVQRFEAIEGYQAEGWSRPRRIVAKIEVNDQGSNLRFVVTNLSGHPKGIYHGVSVQRGNVPEHPIQELKNGLAADRLSAHGFSANGLRLGLHALAYAIVVLVREAAAGVPEIAQAEVKTLRQMLFKVGARVQTSLRRIRFRFSETWPHRVLFQRLQRSLSDFVRQLREEGAAVPLRSGAMPF
jgi:hypothetical protein